MQHKMIPLFSVPLFKTNIGPLDSIERTWIDSLEYPPKAVARDKSDDHLPMVNRGMHILNSGQLKIQNKNTKCTSIFYKNSNGHRTKFQNY